MSDPAGQANRKVHFSDSPSVQFLGEYTCNVQQRAGDGCSDTLQQQQNSGSHGQFLGGGADYKNNEPLVEESSFIQCLLLAGDEANLSEAAAAASFFSEANFKASNPDLLECATENHHQQQQLHHFQNTPCPRPSPEGIQASYQSNYHVSACGELCSAANIGGGGIHPTMPTIISTQPVPNGICCCDHCDCEDSLDSKYITQNTIAYTAASNCAPGGGIREHASAGNNISGISNGPSSVGGGSSGGAGGGGNGQQTAGGNLYSFVPFLLVTGILSITLALLVSVSIIYIQCKWGPVYRLSLLKN